MKIGLLGDFHLGHRNADPEIYRYVIDMMQNKHHVDVIIDGGDLVDKNIVNANQAKDLYDIFKDLKTEYHVIRGNHDSYNNISITQLLSFNDYIHVHNEISNISNILFVPYENNFYSLAEKLDKYFKYSKISTSFRYAVSHLNITNNAYSMIPIDSDNMHYLQQFATNWLNFHIHNPEFYEDMYGSIRNVGSLSSLTFGDHHRSNYAILDTDLYREYHDIPNSIIHITINDNEINDDTLDNIIKQYSIHKINWRVMINPDSNTYFSEREEIKNILNSIKNTNNIEFSYSNNNEQKKKEILSVVDKIKENQKLPLSKQLINQYQTDMKEKLDDEIIELLS